MIEEIEKLNIWKETFLAMKQTFPVYVFYRYVWLILIYNVITCLSFVIKELKKPSHT